MIVKRKNLQVKHILEVKWKAESQFLMFDMDLFDKNKILFCNISKANIDLLMIFLIEPVHLTYLECNLY